MKIFFGILFLLLTGACTLPSAGTGSVQGKVSSCETGDRLPQVSVVYGDSTVYTNEEGRYLYDPVPEGLQGFSFRKDGYHKTVRKVFIPREGIAECDVRLRLVMQGWAVGPLDSGYGVILHSTDGGESWLRQGNPSMIPESDLLSACATDSASCWIVGTVDRFRNQFVILRTEDGGSSWVNQGSSVTDCPPADLKAILAKDNDTAWTVSANAGIILKTVNRGKTWKVCHTSEEIAEYTAISSHDGIHLWCSGKDRNGHPVLNRSSDGGRSWQLTRPNGCESGQSILDVYAVSEDEIYFVGDNDMGIRHSTDGGRNWQRISNIGGTESLNTIFVFDRSEIWIGADDRRIFYSNDRFSNSFLQSVDASPEGNVTKINLLGDGLRGNGIITAESGKESRLFFTKDKGNLWSLSSMPYNFTIYDLDFIGGNN